MTSRAYAALAATIVALATAGLPAAHAQSDSLFLAKPVGGEIFYTNRDTLINITWGGVADTALVRLEYSTDGKRWTLIADSVKGLGYVWSVKGLQPSSNYRVRVLQSRPPNSSDNVVYTGHNSRVADGWWAPGGSRIVTVSARPHIWDSDIGGPVPLVELQGPRATYTGVQWSADSARIVAGTEESGAISFVTATNNVESPLVHPDVVRRVVLAGNSTRLITVCDDNRVRIYDLPSTITTRTLASTTPVTNAAIDSSGTRVLVCADDARVHLIAGGLPVTFAAHSNGVLAGAFSPDGSTVATIGGDATIRLWDATTAVEIWNRGDQFEGVRSLAFSPTGTMLAVGMSDSSVTLWDVATGNRLLYINGIGGAVRGVEWSYNSELFATSGDDSFSHVISVADSARIRRLPHQNRVSSARFSPDGTRVLTTSTDGTAIVWRVAEVVLQADTSAPFSIAPPPPAYARFTATGDTLPIGEQTTLTLAMEAASQLDLSDIDSVQFRMQYDASMLFELQSSIPIRAQTDSAFYRIITLAPIALPLTPATLGTLTFRATLGTDSITKLSYVGFTQIGTGPGIRVESRSDTVLVTGICRANNTARLYNPVGLPLNPTIRRDQGGNTLLADLPECGPISIEAFAITGELRWSHHQSLPVGSPLHLEQPLPATIYDPVYMIVVRTATQAASVLVENVR